MATHYNNATPIGSFKAGLGVEFELSQSLTFAPSLVFYAKGWKNHNQRVYFRNDDGSQALDKDGNPITGIRNRTTTANYLELPLVFNYYFRLSAGHYIVASAGPYVAYGLGGKQTTRGDVGQIGSRKLYYDTQTFKEHGTHRFDGGLTIGLGYQLPSHLTLGIETDLGLTKFNAAGDRNVTALVTLTYQF